MRRPLPDAKETARILGTKRSKPAYRATPPAGRALKPFITALDERFGKGVDGLKARWREIVGERLSARTEPVKLVKPRNGGPASLELKVDGPSAALIQHAAPDILQRVNLFLGPGAVDKLRIVQGPVRTGAPARGAAAGLGRRRLATPLDAAAEAGLQESLSQAPDGALKVALLRLGREILRRG